ALPVVSRESLRATPPTTKPLSPSPRASGLESQSAVLPAFAVVDSLAPPLSYLIMTQAESLDTVPQFTSSSRSGRRNALAEIDVESIDPTGEKLASRFAQLGSGQEESSSSQQDSPSTSSQSPSTSSSSQ
ncbi:hypothetical protein PMAYCL1PPCAC_01337, partial [Pristionchus mayeri]